MQFDTSFIKGMGKAVVDRAQAHWNTISSWRESAMGQMWLCMALGILVGAVTVLLHDIVFWVREWAFALPDDVHLSAAPSIESRYVLAVPIIGGLLLAGYNLIMKRLRSNEIIDAIEANAVYGGRMSLRDSMRLTFATLVSNASGVSVGMEAAYTQMGSGIMSRIGQDLKLRRDDLRIFVAAGSAAAIAAAFNAPLAGAFYAFELILGTYTIAALPQVAIAALSSVMFLRIFTREEPIFLLTMADIAIPLWHYLIFIAMGAMAAGVGIATMKAVTKCEHIFKNLSVAPWIRPALGGLLVGMIALAFPQVLGSGQGAIDIHLHSDASFILIVGLLAAKIIASAVSIGSGFRGGLFSASLFIGCLFGQVAGMIASILLPESSQEMQCLMLVGMGAVAASIVGAPITIVLLILEMTESFSVTTPVLAAVLVSSVMTRYFFGYSFSTWRFHLRGLRIAGGHDVGWVNEMTVGSMMQTGMKTVPAASLIADVQTEFPPGSARHIYIADENGFYKGAVEIATLHARANDAVAVTAPITDLAKNDKQVLFPDQNIKEALELFSSWQLEELPVINSMMDPVVRGVLNESYVLKRYSQELEARNLAQSGAAAPVKVLKSI